MIKGWGKRLHHNIISLLTKIDISNILKIKENKKCVFPKGFMG